MKLIQLYDEEGNVAGLYQTDRVDQPEIIEDIENAFAEAKRRENLGEEGIYVHDEADTILETKEIFRIFIDIEVNTNVI